MDPDFWEEIYKAMHKRRFASQPRRSNTAAAREIADMVIAMVESKKKVTAA